MKYIILYKRGKSQRAYPPPQPGIFEVQSSFCNPSLISSSLFIIRLVRHDLKEGMTERYSIIRNISRGICNPSLIHNGLFTTNIVRCNIKDDMTERYSIIRNISRWICNPSNIRYIFLRYNLYRFISF